MYVGVMLYFLSTVEGKDILRGGEKEGQHLEVGSKETFKKNRLMENEYAG